MSQYKLSAILFTCAFAIMTAMAALVVRNTFRIAEIRLEATLHKLDDSLTTMNVRRLNQRVIDLGAEHNAARIELELHVNALVRRLEELERRNENVK